MMERIPADNLMVWRAPLGTVRPILAVAYIDELEVITHNVAELSDSSYHVMNYGTQPYIDQAEAACDAFLAWCSAGRTGEFPEGWGTARRESGIELSRAQLVGLELAAGYEASL